MSGPVPGMGIALVPYVLAAVAMVGINLYLLSRLFPRHGPAPTRATGILVIGFLLAGLGLWFAVIYAILSPGDASTVSVFIAANSMMAVIGAWFIGLMLRADERPLPRSGWGWPLLVGALLIGNEIVMGVTVLLAAVGPAPYAALGYPGILALIGDSVNTVWFFWAMLATMLFVVLRISIGARERRVLVAFTLTALIGPWVVAQPLFGLLAMTVLMGAVVLLFLRDVRGGTPISVQYSRTLLGIALGFGAMILGQALSYLLGSSLWATLPFAAATVWVMSAEFFVLARWGFAAPRTDVEEPTGESVGGPVRTSMLR